MANDALEFGMKAMGCRLIVKNTLSTKPLPSLREANIQIDKLERMAGILLECPDATNLSGWPNNSG